MLYSQRELALRLQLQPLTHTLPRRCKMALAYHSSWKISVLASKSSRMVGLDRYLAASVCGTIALERIQYLDQIPAMLLT